MKTIRVAMAQINVTVGDLIGNVEKAASWVNKARRVGADIVTFPELALCGYPPEDLLIKPRFVADNRSALELFVPRCHGLTVVAGFTDSGDGKVYNAAALIHNGELVDVYHKVELPNYGVFDERRYFYPGARPVAFDMDKARFFLSICEDIWVPDSITEAWALQLRADFVLNISASPFHTGKLATRRGIVHRFAEITGTTVLYNNLVGGQDELVFDGGSLVMTPEGAVQASGKLFEEDMVIFDIATEMGLRKSPRPVGTQPNQHRHNLQALGPREKEKMASPPNPDMDHGEAIYHALVLGTRDYVRKNGFAKVVLGLSGGIDSSLTAALAVAALGQERVIGVTMPSQYTSHETFSDAHALAGNLNIRVITVPINAIYRAYLDVLSEPLGTSSPGIEGENLQARIRGNILMALSNRFGWLVLTTSNKSETAVGYCTLYGDMAGGFAVIKDVPKTLVYELSEYVNRKAGKEIIPRTVIDRAPTAELRQDQKDEDSLAPYRIVDPIVQAYVEEDQAPDEICALGFDAETVDKVLRMVHQSEFKRRQAPPGVKITPKAFGKDRRLPITNRYLRGLQKPKQG